MSTEFTQGLGTMSLLSGAFKLLPAMLPVQANIVNTVIAGGAVLASVAKPVAGRIQKPREPKVVLSDKERFLNAFDRIVKELVKDKDQHPKELLEYLDDMCRYNVPFGKLNRGLAVIQGVRTMRPSLLKDDESFFRMCALGWCIEFLQASFLVADDIMDESVTRRGQPCWYKLPRVQVKAVNDAMMLESLIFVVMKKYFNRHPKYVQLIELFHEMTYRTCKGQLWDMMTAPIGEVDLSKYTMERYQHIVKYKTAYYTFYLPVACALTMVGVEDCDQYKIAETICCEMGEFFQVQDDYLDCYADAKVLGKVGTDIQDNKCGWLVCQALMIASKSQLEVIHEHYGRHSEESIAKIKELYIQLGLEERYKRYEEESYLKIKNLIDQKADRVSKEMYTWLLGKIYKREK